MLAPQDSTKYFVINTAAQGELSELGDSVFYKRRASGIVMVLTSPWAYNFNCAPQSSQYLYTTYISCLNIILYY